MPSMVSYYMFMVKALQPGCALPAELLELDMILWVLFLVLLTAGLREQWKGG
jgi:hypothetical protein